MPPIRMPSLLSPLHIYEVIFFSHRVTGGRGLIVIFECDCGTPEASGGRGHSDRQACYSCVQSSRPCVQGTLSVREQADITLPLKLLPILLLTREGICSALVAEEDAGMLTGMRLSATMDPTWPLSGLPLFPLSTEQEAGIGRNRLNTSSGPRPWPAFQNHGLL